MMTKMLMATNPIYIRNWWGEKSAMLKTTKGIQLQWTAKSDMTNTQVNRMEQLILVVCGSLPDTTHLYHFNGVMFDPVKH